MTSFEKAIHFVFDAEGGLSDNVHDRGGLTKYGISQKSYPSVDIANLTKEQAIQIYKEYYWDRMHCDTFDESLAIVLFDTGINCGVKIASQWLQSTCNTKGSKLLIDGKIGAKTILMALQYDQRGLLCGVTAFRLKLYNRIVSKDKTQKGFYKGWINRVSNLLFYVI